MRCSMILGLLPCVLLVLPLSLHAQQPSTNPVPEPGRAPRLFPPAIDADAAGAEAIKQFDANNDGKLSGDELDKCPGLKAAIDEIDPSGKGEITAETIAARIKAWQDSKLARMTLSCTVTHNGKPLAGAEVKFVPEKFLGKNMQAATGKTDKNGIAMLSIPTSGPRDPPGVAPGFYRVEITKAGETDPRQVQHRHDPRPGNRHGRQGNPGHEGHQVRLEVRVARSIIEPRKGRDAGLIGTAADAVGPHLRAAVDFPSLARGLDSQVVGLHAAGSDAGSAGLRP